MPIYLTTYEFIRFLLEYVAYHFISDKITSFLVRLPLHELTVFCDLTQVLFFFQWAGVSNLPKLIFTVPYLIFGELCV